MDAEQTSAKITLRPVAESDREFLLAVYASGREIELSLVPWDDAMKRSFIVHQYDAQDSYYQTEYAAAKHDVIMLGGVPVGRIYVSRTAEEIAILDMAVLPEFRKGGVATTIVNRLKDEARESGRSIRIFIESFNPASNLFTELGFRQTAEDGHLVRYDWIPS